MLVLIVFISMARARSVSTLEVGAYIDAKSIAYKGVGDISIDFSGDTISMTKLIYIDVIMLIGCFYLRLQRLVTIIYPHYSPAMTRVYRRFRPRHQTSLSKTFRLGPEVSLAARRKGQQSFFFFFSLNEKGMDSFSALATST